jgi:hypothetical protein
VQGGSLPASQHSLTRAVLACRRIRDERERQQNAIKLARARAARYNM